MPSESEREALAAAESAFLELVAASDSVTADAVERLCGERPELAPDLRRLFSAYREASGRLKGKTSLAPGGSGAGVAAALLERFGDMRQSEGRYRVLDEVARGGMGSVCKVWDRRLRRALAMKLILGKGGDSDSAAEHIPEDRLGRFLDEAQVTSQLDHPGIVPVHDLAMDQNGRVFFTMKLVRGRELGDVFEKVWAGDSDWTVTRALSVLLKVCEAMAFAHDKGVIHRDLKPQNIMVGRFGETYVMDWGLARVLGGPTRPPATTAIAASRLPSLVVTDRKKEPSTPSATLEGDVLGTPGYMSPEQARGDLDHLGSESDVYAVGAILYQLLTRQVPYADRVGGRGARAFVDAVKRGPPTPIEVIEPGVPRELAAIAAKAMARDAGERYPTMVSMAEDLRAYLEGRVVSAYRTGAQEALVKWVGRNRALAAAAAALIVVAFCGLSAVLWLQSKRNRELEQKNAEITRSEGLAREAEAVAARQREEAVQAREKAELARRRAEAMVRFLRETLSAVDPTLEGRDASVIDVLNAAARRIKRELSEAPVVKVGLLRTIGASYRELGRLDLAETMLRDALDLSRMALPDDHPEAAGARADLAGLLSEMRRLDEAEELVRGAGDFSPSGTLELDHELLRAMSLLASLRERRADSPAAMGLWSEALRWREELFGSDHEETVRARHELAMASARQASLDDPDPEREVRAVLEERRRALGPDDPRTLEAAHELAAILFEHGWLPEARLLAEATLKDCRRLLGSRSLRTLESMALLARIAESERRLAEAEELRREQCRELSLLWTSDDALIEPMWALARAIAGQRRLAEAEPVYRDVRVRCQTILGEEHPDSIAVSIEFARLLHDLGESEAARQVASDLTRIEELDDRTRARVARLAESVGPLDGGG